MILILQHEKICQCPFSSCSWALDHTWSSLNETPPNPDQDHDDEAPEQQPDGSVVLALKDVFNCLLTLAYQTLHTILLNRCVNCVSLRCSGPLWSSTQESGWPWRCSWEPRGRQPCVSRPAGVQILDAPAALPHPSHHRPLPETAWFGKSHDSNVTRAQLIEFLPPVVSCFSVGLF